MEQMDRGVIWNAFKIDVRTQDPSIEYVLAAIPLHARPSMSVALKALHNFIKIGMAVVCKSTRSKNAL